MKIQILTTFLCKFETKKKNLCYVIYKRSFLKVLGLINRIACQTSQYYSWIVGNPGDFKLPDESRLTGGILLAGGSTDQDSAMRWFLKKALGGDVIVFRNARNSTNINVNFAIPIW